MRTTFLALAVLFGVFLALLWGRDRGRKLRTEQAQNCWRLHGPEIKAVEECLILEYHWHQGEALAEAVRRDNNRRAGRGR